MPLDALQVGPQVRALAAHLESRREFHRQRLPIARDVLVGQAAGWERLASVAADASRRLATPIEPLDVTRGAPTLPPEHRVVATDGSQIEPDHHGIAEYYLINLGWAVITYGSAPAAQLDNRPSLYFEADDLFISDGERRVPVQDGHLAAKRSVMELECGAELAEPIVGDGLPTVVLGDGTLLLWVLEQRPHDFIRERLLTQYVRQMERLRELETPLTSYISRPRSTEVSGLLREATCRGEIGQCAPCRRFDGPCALEALHDRELFRDLALGQRSARFAVTLSKDIGQYYVGHRIHFFFLRVDADEIARVEVPEWVVQDPAALDLVHAVVLDQSQRGQGYPVAIARAHEKAIVSGADRSILRTMIESQLVQAGLSAASSAKQASKRVHAV